MDAKDFFPEKYNSKNIVDIVKRILKKTDMKNDIERNAYLETNIPYLLNAIEKEYNIEGFSKGLGKDGAKDFIEAIIDLQSETDINYNPHNYFAHMLTGKITDPGIAGSLLGLFMHGNNVTQEVSPFSNAAEIAVGNMTKEMFGYTAGTENFKNAASFITNGGTDANHLAMLVGRNWSYLQKEEINFQKAGFPGLVHSKKYRDPVMIVPESSHYSLDEIANDLGIGTENLVQIKSDENFRMDTNDLEKELSRINPKHQKLISVMSVFGSTELGSVDDINRIYNLVKGFEAEHDESVWLHIDAAYGGPFILTDEYQHLQNVFSKVDSITFDPHKLLWVPYNAGSVTFKNALTLRTVSTDAPYIANGDVKGMTDKKFVKNLPSHYGSVKLGGTQTTQGVISTYLTMKCFGKDGVKHVLDHSKETATYLAHKLKEARPKNGRIEVINENPDMNLVGWRFIPSSCERLTKETYLQQDGRSSKEALNKLNEGIFEHFKGKNEKYMLSKTRLDTYDLVVQRVAIMNPHTNKNDMDELVKEYVRHVESLE